MTPPIRRPQLAISRPVLMLTVAATVIVILLSAVSLVVTRINTPLGFDGDEAHHAMWGAAVYSDLVQGDLEAFLRHSYAQNRFPPLYSYLQVPFLAAGGITPLTHRLVGVIFLLVLCGSVYLCVVWSSNTKNAWVGGCLAALLVTGCPTLLLLATRVYIEPASLALMMLTYAAYLRAWSTGNSRWAWGAGLLHLASWFLKWQFGMLISIVLVVHILWTHYPRLRASITNPLTLRTMLPAWIAMSLWLANPYQLREFIMYLTGVPKPDTWQSLVTAGLTMQLGFLFNDYNATILAGAITGGALFYGLLRRHSPACLLFTISAVVAVVTMANLRGGAEQRIGLWLLPPLWILVGIGVNEAVGGLASYVQHVKPAYRQILMALVVVGLLAGGISNTQIGLQRSALHAAEGRSAQLWPVLDYITETVPPDHRITTVGCWVRDISPRAVKWAYLAKYGPVGLGYDDLHLWQYPPPDPYEKDILHFRWPWRVRLPARGPLQMPDPVTVLQRAAIDTIIVCRDLSTLPPLWQQELVQAATHQLGFEEVGVSPGVNPGQQLTVYTRSYDK